MQKSTIFLGTYLTHGGKTAACQILKNKLPNCAFLDGDWCWVMHEQAIIDEILSKLETGDCLVHTISLICDADSLRKRLQKDVDEGIRSADVIQRSIARIGLYEELDTGKIDVSHITPEQEAEAAYYAANPALIFPGLEIRLHQRRVLKGGADINLTRLKYGALCCLAT